MCLPISEKKWLSSQKRKWEAKKISTDLGAKYNTITTDPTISYERGVWGLKVRQPFFYSALRNWRAHTTAKHEETRSKEEFLELVDATDSLFFRTVESDDDRAHDTYLGENARWPGGTILAGGRG